MVLVSVRLLEHNLVKGVETGFAFCEFLRGGKCAVNEDLAARGTVGEGDLLIGAKEAHRVYARNGTATQRMHADLFGIALAAYAFAAILGVVARLRFGGNNLVKQHLCRARRGVDLLVVVRLADLDIKAGEARRVAWATRWRSAATPME